MGAEINMGAKENFWETLDPLSNTILSNLSPSSSTLFYQKQNQEQLFLLHVDGSQIVGEVIRTKGKKSIENLRSWFTLEKRLNIKVKTCRSFSHRSIRTSERRSFR